MKQGGEQSNTSHPVHSDWAQARPRGQEDERQKVKEDRARAAEIRELRIRGYPVVSRREQSGEVVFRKWESVSPQFKALWISPPDDKRGASVKTPFRFGQGRAPYLASYVN